MTFKLKCIHGKFCLDDISLGDITDLFTVIEADYDSVSITDGESLISLFAKPDNSIEMFFMTSDKLIHCKGCKFEIHGFPSFDIIRMSDESYCDIFSIAIDKE